MSLKLLLDELSPNFNGRVILPQDEGYDNLKKVWNYTANRKPSCILECRGTQDVSLVVHLSNKYGLDVSVRGGGHNVNGSAVQDGAIMIDLSGMRGVHIYHKYDAITNTLLNVAYVEGGAQWRDLDRETGRCGFANPGGLVSTTGVGGLTLGGGIGWLSRRFGLACDSIESVEIVIANGSVIKANSQENSDIYWAIKGGGGNFGIVTSFEFRLQPLGNIAYCLLQFPYEKRYEVMTLHSQLIHTTNNNVSFYAFVDKEGIIIIGFYSSDSESEVFPSNDQLYDKMAQLSEPYFALQPIRGEIDIKPYYEFQHYFDAGNQSGKCYYWKSLYLDKFDDGPGLKPFLDDLFDSIENSYGRTSVEFMHLGGAVRNSESCFEHKNAVLEMHSISVWEAHEHSIQNNTMKTYSDWARNFIEKMKKHSSYSVGYSNVTSEEDYDQSSTTSTNNKSLWEQKIKNSFGNNYEKLLELKEKYDPDNFFHYNHNIIPRNTKKVWKKVLPDTPKKETTSSFRKKGENIEDLSTVAHENVGCDSCGKLIMGARFKCGNCSNYDLCEECEKTTDHSTSHVFLKIRRPLAWQTDQLNREFLPRFYSVSGTALPPIPAKTEDN